MPRRPRFDRIADGQGRVPMRGGVQVATPLGPQEWSISLPTDTPDRRVQDQIIVSYGYEQSVESHARSVSLRVGDKVAVLDSPAVQALRILLQRAATKS